MRVFLYTLFAVSAFSPFVAAHIEMIKRRLAVSLHWNLPVSDHVLLIAPPYRSKSNTNVAQADIDYSMTTPLKPDGSDYPCKVNPYSNPSRTMAYSWLFLGVQCGFQCSRWCSHRDCHSVSDTTLPGNRPLILSRLSSGQKSSIKLDGDAVHNGGSCQISLSFDGGKSFKGLSKNGSLPFISEAHRFCSRQGLCLNASQSYTTNFLPHWQSFIGNCVRTINSGPDPNQTYE